MFLASFWQKVRVLPKGDAALLVNQRTVKLHRKSTHIREYRAKVGTAVLEGSLRTFKMHTENLLY